MVHQWRSQEQAILVGTGTIVADDPKLNVRLVEGRQPVPFILGKRGNVPNESKIHSFNPVFFNSIEEITKYCLYTKIQSVLVEGGAKVLDYFIQNNYWDEARIITNTQMNIGEGIKAPVINIDPKNTIQIDSDTVQIIYNSQAK